MKIIEKDILTVKEGIIFQCVNCQKKQASGLALAIRNKWPIVYNEYMRYSDIWPNDFQRLGEYQLIKVEEDLIVANIYGQLNYGYDKQRYVDYSALKNAFRRLATNKEDYIYFPYLFASDRAGSDWNIVSKMIEFYFPNAIICKLPDKKSSGQDRENYTDVQDRKNYIS